MVEWYIAILSFIYFLTATSCISCKYLLLNKYVYNLHEEFTFQTIVSDKIKEQKVFVIHFATNSNKVPQQEVFVKYTLHLPKARVESCSAATTLASYIKNFPGWPTLFLFQWGRPIRKVAYTVTYILTSWMIKADLVWKGTSILKVLL